MPKEYLSTKRLPSQERKRQQILDAFLHLLEEKHFDAVSIQDICDAAGIHRTTFYNHFYDKFDLLTFGIEKTIAELFPVEQLYAPNADVLSQQIIKYIKKNRNMLGNITKSGYSNELYQSTGLAFEKYLYNTLSSPDAGYSSKLPVEIAIKFFCGGLTQLLFLWLDNSDMPESDMRDQLGEIIYLVNVTAHSNLK
ncbi:TetR/AcrR family transcriptional regulator [Paenibacillus kribbensis]|uniref:TetR/AcrR family transcriptional regulator n=1 Tax=Paenibacillus kribbensis TaxID=172713 RepID=UPI002DB8322C|nr:TetR/AcrR family transcriptional regulator [Paenibacillus kribbensis]MEC0232800.1 TetR/AcrR family transcriptional regulator [Paenibacillus kribbensis]